MRVPARLTFGFGVATAAVLLGAMAASRAPGDAGVTIDPTEVRTVLPRDAIRAIDDPQFVAVAHPQADMADRERVLGLTINGDARAYPVNVLSVHEIVNDVVGGQPVAVTW